MAKDDNGAFIRNIAEVPWRERRVRADGSEMSEDLESAIVDPERGDLGRRSRRRAP